MFHHLLLKLSLTELTDVLESGTDLAGFLSELFTFLIGLAAVLSMLMIVYGGFLYMTAGATGKVNDAKEKIKNAILGLVLALSSYLILSFINPGLVELNLPSFDELDEPTFSGFTFPGQGPGTMYTGGICDISKDCIPGDRCCFVERDKEGNVIYENDSPIEKDCDETFALQEPSIKKSSQFASSFLTLTALAQDKDEENKICTPVGGGIRGEECEDSDEEQKCNCDLTGDPRLSCIGPIHGTKKWQPFRKRGEQCWADSDCETENCLEYNAQYKICADKGATKETTTAPTPEEVKVTFQCRHERSSTLMAFKNVPRGFKYVPLPDQSKPEDVVFLASTRKKTKKEIKEKYEFAEDLGMANLCTNPKPTQKNATITYPTQGDETKVLEIAYADSCGDDFEGNWGYVAWGKNEERPTWKDGSVKNYCDEYFDKKQPTGKDCCGQFLYCGYLKNPCPEDWNKTKKKKCLYGASKSDDYVCCYKDFEQGPTSKRFKEECTKNTLSFLDQHCCETIRAQSEEEDPVRQKGSCYDFCKSHYFNK